MEEKKKINRLSASAAIGAIAVALNFLLGRILLSPILQFFYTAGSGIALNASLALRAFSGPLPLVIAEIVYMKGVQKAKVPAAAVFMTCILSAVASGILFFLPHIGAIFANEIVSLAMNFVVYLILASIFLKLSGLLPSKNSANEANAKNPSAEALAFFKRCNAAGVKDVQTPEGLARLALCGKNSTPPLDEAAAMQLYLQGKAESERKEAAKKAAQLQKLLAQEAALEERSMRYLDCVGQEKAVKMCLDEAADCRRTMAEYTKQADAVLNGATSTYRRVAQREHSWAVHGGIASGIAGGAAGLAVASDVQRKNAEIRASNEDMSRAISHLTANALSGIYQNERAAKGQAEAWEKKSGRGQAPAGSGIACRGAS